MIICGVGVMSVINIGGTIVVQDTKGNRVFVDILLALYVVSSIKSFIHNSEIIPIFQLQENEVYLTVVHSSLFIQINNVML